MDVIRQLLAGKSRGQLVMCGAIVLLFVSQFFIYVNDPASAMLDHMTDTNYTTGITIFGWDNIGTGWELHPQAYVLLVVLAFAFFRDDFANSRLFQRFGYWAGVVLIFFSLTPASPLLDGTPGAKLGFLALAIGIVAAVLNIGDRRRDKSAAAAEPKTPAA